MGGMHLLGPAYTTTSTRKRKTKSKTSRQQKAEKEHQAFLKKHGVDDESLERKRTKQRSVNNIPCYQYDKGKTSDRIAGNGTAKDRKQYTGTEIAGIVTTHKSNLMPVRRDNKQAAKDAANMRR